MRKINNLGTYPSFAEVWRRFPHGGHQGDFLSIGSQRFVWDALHHNWLADDPVGTTSRCLLRQTGDLHLDGEFHVGGRAAFHQPAVFHSDVAIEGHLLCRHFSRHDCGLYATAEELMAAHPTPRRGDWALVGTTATPELWTCSSSGQWQRHDEPVALAEAFHLDAYDEARAIINTIASQGYVFAGVATPATNPIRPADYNVFYIAAQPGEYVHFGGIHIDYCSVLMWNHDTDTDSNGMPDGQWTAQLLLRGIFVREDNIDEKAVTTAKIDDLAITTDKMADRAVTGDKIACDAITACHIKDGEVTIEKTTGIASAEQLENLRDALQSGLASAGSNIGTLNAAVNALQSALASCVKSITVNASQKIRPDGEGNIALTITTDQGEQVIPIPAVIDDAAIQTIREAIAPSINSAIETALEGFDPVDYDRIMQNIWGAVSGNVTAAIADALDQYSPVAKPGDVNDIWTSINSRIWSYIQNDVANAISNALEQFTPPSGDDEEEEEEILIGYTDLDTENGEIDNSTFEEGGKYNISAAYTLVEDVTIPARVTIHFSQGGSISANTEYDLVGQQTKLTAPAAQQIFGENVAIGGTWDIPFSRPEWFGAENNAIDYGAIPIRVYRDVLPGNATVSDSAANVTAHYPDEFFDPTDYVEAYNGGNSDIEAVTHLNVYYDSANNRFLILNNGTYYTQWNNDNDYNDPSGHARTDVIYFSVEEGISETDSGTSATVTLAHRIDAQGNKTYIKDMLASTDSTVAFQKAINMTGGNVRLRKGVYRLNGQGEDKVLQFMPTTKADFDGQGATLYFEPTQYASSISEYAFFVNAPADNEEDIILHDFTVSTANFFHGKSYASNYKRLDLLSSFLMAFQHNKGNNVTYQDILIRNCFKDFSIKKTEGTSELADHITLRRIHTENSYAGIYHGYGVQHLFVESCSFYVRPHIDTGAHTFYLAYDQLLRTTTAHVSDTTIHINGGFMSQPINLQGSQGYGSYARFTNCTFDCAALGTAGEGTKIFFDNCRYYSNGAKAVNVASVAPQNGEFNTYHIVVQSECHITNSIFKLGTKKLNAAKDSKRARTDVLRVEDSYVESNYTYSRGSAAVYTDGAGGGVLTSAGTLIVKNCVLIAPNSPAISFFSTSSSGPSGSDMRGKVAARLIVQNNTARCKSALVFICASDTNALAITDVHINGNTLLVTPTEYAYQGTNTLAALVGWKFGTQDNIFFNNYSSVTDNIVTSSTTTLATLYTSVTSGSLPAPQGGRVFQNYLNGSLCTYENDPLQRL